MINTQNKLLNNKKPRVSINYDVETEGSSKKIELPYVGGIITDLSGDTINKKSDLSFKTVDINNLDSYLRKQEATLEYIVKNIINEDKDENIEVKLSFTDRNSMKIESVIEQIPQLKEIYNKIQTLNKIYTLINNNNKFKEFLIKTIQHDKKNDLLPKIEEALKTL